MTDYPWDLDLAASRGWDRDAHQTALDSGNEDAISLTHPTNWLTEEEVEFAIAVMDTLRLMLDEGLIETVPA